MTQKILEGSRMIQNVLKRNVLNSEPSGTFETFQKVPEY